MTVVILVGESAAVQTNVADLTDEKLKLKIFDIEHAGCGDAGSPLAFNSRETVDSRARAASQNPGKWEGLRQEGHLA